MEIIKYQDTYKQQVINMILHIQNSEAKINLTIEEQPDLLDVPYIMKRTAAHLDSGGKKRSNRHNRLYELWKWKCCIKEIFR